MQASARKLITLAKSIEPKKGFFGYFDLVDALESKPAKLDEFKNILSTVDIADLSSISDDDEEYGWIVMGAADALGCIPDYPNNFLTDSAINAISDSNLMDSLCSACILNDTNAVTKLSKRIDVNSLDRNKQAPLGYAIGNGHIECVRILIQQGADPNLVQNWGNSQMHICASTASSKEIFDLLLDAGGDLMAKNDNGETVVELLKSFRRKKWIGK